MKLLAFADMHGSVKALNNIISLTKNEKIDYIVCCGDISIFSHDLGKLLSKFDSLNIPIMLVHGNHETKSGLKQLCKKYKNINFVHKKTIIDGKHLFIGYGGGGFALTDKEFERFIKKISKTFKKNQKIIIITHGPPYGTKVDLVLDSHVGNKSYRVFILKYRPELFICGHLHENFGKMEKSGKTLVINPGPYGIIIEV